MFSHPHSYDRIKQNPQHRLIHCTQDGHLCVIGNLGFDKLNNRLIDIIQNEPGCPRLVGASAAAEDYLTFLTSREYLLDAEPTLKFKR